MFLKPQLYVMQFSQSYILHNMNYRASGRFLNRITITQDIREAVQVIKL
jgi:hypothetical protein